MEIHNQGAAPIDLGGYHFTDDPANLTKSRLPAGTTIAAGGWRSFSEAQLGLNFSLVPPENRVFIALVDPEGKRVIDAFNFEPKFDEYSEARVPNDDAKFSPAADPTRDAANAVSVNTDVVIDEIMYHPIDNDNRKEYVELYNRGAQAVDLSGWSLSDGLNFTFQPGTILPAGGYLVIARDPGLFTGPASIYRLPSSVVMGPSTPEALAKFGALRNSGERLTLSDSLGRTVDTVRFHEGGEWPRWPDGLGSSLELIDPNQDNRFGQAWDASDDSSKATFKEFSYVARHQGGESELALVLLDRGIALVDDVSIIGGGVIKNDQPLIANNETWKYIKGTQEPPAAWKDLGFDDASWLSGATGIGYGDNDDATVLSDMRNTYMTIFCRRTFTVADRAAIDELVLSLVVEDGFYAYLNGTQVASDNVTSPAYDAAAPAAIEPRLLELDLSPFKNLLRDGTNVLAVQVHNAGLGSSDLSFIPSLIDRITTISGGTEQVTNGTFESNTQGWMIEGTHIRSGRTNQSPISGSGSLKIIASARGDNKVNRIETPDALGNGLNNLNLNEDLLISFKARWVAGSQTLLTHGYDHEMARAHALDVPLDLGTPGARNQVTGRLISQTGAANLGPVISDAINEPAVPGPGEQVTVRARVVDPDGIASVTLRYALNTPSSTPLSVAMARIGASDVFEAKIPGQAQATRVVFFITASDGGGRTGRYPVDIVARTHPLLVNPPSAGLNDLRYCVYRHDIKNPATSFHSYRFYMTGASENELSNRQLHSNDPVDGSFVFGGSRIYYEATTRFSGSPFARAGWGGSYRVRMPRDNILHDRIRKFGLEDHHGNGGDARERLSHYLIRQSQGALGVPYSDVFIMVRWQVNDRVTITREHYWVPDGDFVSLWFPDDDEGDFLEMDDRFLFNDTGGMARNTDARVLYPPPSSRSDGNGANKENYRWFFGMRAKEGADEYANFIAFAKVLDPGATSNTAQDEGIWSVMNVEEMLRIWAVEMNIDDWDSWGMSRGKNCYFYRPDLDGRFHLMAWDLELTYANANSFAIPANPQDPFNPGGFSEVNRLMNRPVIRRMYYSILDEMVNGPGRWFHSSYLSPYMNRLAALGMTNTAIGQPGQFIDQRASLLQSRIQTVVYPQVRLAITTNNGNNLTTNQPIITLSGTAPVEIGEMMVSRNGNLETTTTPAYSSLTNWTIANIPLLPGANVLEIFGLDLQANVIDSDSITVTTTSSWTPPVLNSLNPPAAIPGIDIDILGSSLHNGLRVFFGAQESPRVVYDEAGATPGKIIARVPAGAGTVNVTVRNLDGQASNTLAFTFQAPPSTFIRGDANGDGAYDLPDAVKILLYLFKGSAVNCQDALDVDDNETIDSTDAIILLMYLFQDGPAPRAPFPLPGADPAGAALGCQR